jgi:hypothetical protein
VAGNADHRQLPRTILDSDLWKRPQRGYFRLPPGLPIFYIVFLICIFIGLTSLISIYSQIPVLLYFSFEINFIHFVKEVSETLPTIQGTYLALQKQQLVEEFSKSMFPLPSKTTQSHVSTEEPEHPIPTHNPTSPKSPKPESSPSTQADHLVLAIKKLGKMKFDAGKLCEPELFIRKDPKKLKAFIFQCQLYFQDSDFDSNSRKVTFALSYLWDVVQEWFELGISGDKYA